MLEKFKIDTIEFNSLTKSIRSDNLIPRFKCKEFNKILSDIEFIINSFNKTESLINPK